jgi:hypothetical protein
MQNVKETDFARDCRKAFDLNTAQLRGLSEQDLFALLKKSFLDAK